MSTNTWNANTLLKLSGSYWQTFALHAAVKIDLFTIIDDNLFTSKEISNILKANNDGLERLCNALCAMELLTKTDNKYSNTEESKKFLSTKSENYIGYIIMHHHYISQAWGKLDECVLSGKPAAESICFTQDEKQRQNFLMGMFNAASNIAPEIADKIDLTDKTHLLDLGCGPGTFAIHFCLKNKKLKATGFDLPTTKQYAKATIKQFGLENRIDFIGGDFLFDEIKGNFDVVWLSHILHGQGPRECNTIIKKAVKLLTPGGMLMVHDFILDNTLDKPLFPALFSLNMLVGTSFGRAYSQEQLINMLKKSDLKNISHIPFNNPNSSGLVLGIK